MAGDGQREICRTIVDTEAAKVYRLSDGRIVGTAGETAFGLDLIEWLEGKGEKPKRKPDEDFAALLLNLDGSVSLITTSCIPVRIPCPAAIGSGMDFAIGAMEAGKTPATAVAIAIKRDPGSGGSITTLHLQSNVETLNVG